MLKESAFQQPLQKAAKIENAIGTVTAASARLGTDAGPGYLQWKNAELANYEQLSRIQRIGEIRQTIKARTLPILMSHKAVLDTELSNLVTSTLNQIHAYAETGDVTPVVTR